MRSGKVSFGSAVLICIIFLIVAVVLFPMFARCGDGGLRKPKCLNNLKQCAQALKLYADDYDGMMPSSGVYTPSISADAFCCRLTAGGTYSPTDGYKRTWPQMLHDNMKRPDIVFCPSDPNTMDDNNNVVSYWYKYANDLAWRDPAVKARTMTDFGYESDQVAFFERAGWHFADPGGPRAMKQCNVAFIDTHVETIVLPPIVRTQPEKPACGPPPDRYESADARAFHRNCEPWFYNCTMPPEGGPNYGKGPTTTSHNPSTDYDAF